MSDEPMPFTPVRATRGRVTVEHVRVTSSNRRAVARWCGGYATDDLRWDSRLRGYVADCPRACWFMRHVASGVLVPTIGNGLPVLATTGEHVIRHRDGTYTVMGHEKFAAHYGQMIDEEMM